jgi:hypothetical protein
VQLNEISNHQADIDDFNNRIAEIKARRDELYMFKELKLD